MLYRVRARFLPDRLAEFHARLTDGSIADQRPDGREIVASMQRAVITQEGVAEWYETCYCSTPLKHERETQYDHYFVDLETTEVEASEAIEGASFWAYLEALASE